jgi:hypothetical protein
MGSHAPPTDHKTGLLHASQKLCVLSLPIELHPPRHLVIICTSELKALLNGHISGACIRSRNYILDPKKNERFAVRTATADGVPCKYVFLCDAPVRSCMTHHIKAAFISTDNRALH